MQTIRQTRHQNFLRLFEEFKAMIRSVEPDAPERGMMMRMAVILEPDAPKKQAAYLSQMKHDMAPMSSALARRLEDALAKPIGWMDVPQSPDTPETDQEARMVAAVLRLYRRDPAVIHDLLIDNFPEPAEPPSKE